MSGPAAKNANGQPSQLVIDKLKSVATFSDKADAFAAKTGGKVPVPTIETTLNGKPATLSQGVAAARSAKSPKAPTTNTGPDTVGNSGNQTEPGKNDVFKLKKKTVGSDKETLGNSQSLLG